METFRAFLAAKIDPSNKEILQHIQDQLRIPENKISWVKPQNFHLTFHFLGDITSQQVEGLNQSLLASLKGIPSINTSLTNVGTFPLKGTPRIIWMGLEDGEGKIAALAKEIFAMLKRSKFRLQKETFHPHITLGRVRLLKEKDQLLEKIQEIDPPREINQQIKSIILFKSTLDPEGSIYTPLKEYPLLYNN